MLGLQAPEAVPNCELPSWWFQSKHYYPISHVPSSLIYMCGCLGTWVLVTDSLTPFKHHCLWTWKYFMQIHPKDRVKEKSSKVRVAFRTERERRHEESLGSLNYNLYFREQQNDTARLDPRTKSYVFKLKCPSQAYCLIIWSPVGHNLRR